MGSGIISTAVQLETVAVIKTQLDDELLSDSAVIRGKLLNKT